MCIRHLFNIHDYYPNFLTINCLSSLLRISCILISFSAISTITLCIHVSSCHYILNVSIIISVMLQTIQFISSFYYYHLHCFLCRLQLHERVIAPSISANRAQQPHEEVSIHPEWYYHNNIIICKYFYLADYFILLFYLQCPLCLLPLHRILIAPYILSQPYQKVQMHPECYYHYYIIIMLVWFHR